MLSDSEISQQKRKVELSLCWSSLSSSNCLDVCRNETRTHLRTDCRGFSGIQTDSRLSRLRIHPNIKAKKQQFFDFLQDYVRYENGSVSDLRLQLRSYADIADSGAPLSGRERDWVVDLAIAYNVDTNTTTDRVLVNELLLKVDVIPASIVLAQAANESAWGTSRFALEGNNVFGQWCFVEGCGIVPNRRVEGATHEVKSFDTIEDAIESYFLNINSHRLYIGFRQERARLRQLGQRLDPFLLVQELGRYSQRGESYIDEVQTMIQQNDLRQRDRRWMEN